MLRSRRILSQVGSQIQRCPQLHFKSSSLSRPSRRHHARYYSSGTGGGNPTFLIDLEIPDEGEDSGAFTDFDESFRESFNSLQPEEIMKELDKHIVGQTEAKRAVAVAMRSRWRRNQLSEVLRKEIIPKNILMIGPTGVGKTEVARRMAKLADAPFIKVEATKYTEVGFRGQDVDQIIKDLIEIAIQHVKDRETKKIQPIVAARTEEAILDHLLGKEIDDKHNTFLRNQFREMLRNSELDKLEVLTDLKPPSKKVAFTAPIAKVPPKFAQQLFQNIAGNVNEGGKKKQRSIPIKDFRPLVEQHERSKLLNSDSIVARAIKEAEEYGIVFIDEIDKIAASDERWHADASDEGVQRDLLPIIEGTKVATDHGEVDTGKMLFIAAGAFHQVKPSDLLAELQGRLPIRVQLTPLNEDDMYRILTEPENNSIKQQIAMISTEGVDLRFTDEAIRKIAQVASEVNHAVENIGARRLFTVMEKVLEELSFNASKHKGQTFIVDASDVEQHLAEFRGKNDLKSWIL